MITDRLLCQWVYLVFRAKFKNKQIRFLETVRKMYEQLGELLSLCDRVKEIRQAFDCP